MDTDGRYEAKMKYECNLSLFFFFLSVTRLYMRVNNWQSAFQSDPSSIILTKIKKQKEFREFWEISWIIKYIEDLVIRSSSSDIERRDWFHLT